MERSSPALDRRRNAPARNPGSSGRHSENATCRGPLQAERRVPYFLLFAPSHQAFYRTRKQHVGSLLHQRLLRVSRADFFVPWLTFLLSSVSAPLLGLVSVGAFCLLLPHDIPSPHHGLLLVGEGWALLERAPAEVC